MNQDNKPRKKGKNLLQQLLWWQIDDNELSDQKAGYSSLKFYESARGISFICTVISAVVTTFSVLFLGTGVYAYLDVIFLLILGFFMLRGQRWAFIVAMILWTLEKIYIVYSGGVNTLFITLIWWAAFMHFFYLAYKVEVTRMPAKSS